MGEEATQKKQKRRRGKHRDDDQPQAADPAAIVNQKDSASEGVKIAVKNDNITIDRPPLQPLDLRLSRINKETVDYFKNIEQFLLDPDHDHSDLLPKVLDEVDGKEIALAADYGTSRIVEQILKLSTDFQLRVFFDRLRGSFPQLFMHQYASHVIQTMLGQCALRIGNVSDDNSGQSDTPEGGELMSLKDLFLEMCAELDGYWPALMVDTYGSHLLRTVLFILSGRTLATDQIKSKSSRKFANNHQLIKADGEQMPVPSTVKVSPEFTAHLTKIVTVIVNGVTDSQVRSMAVNLVASPVLQTLLQVISPTLADSLIDRLLMNITSGDLSGNESIDQQRRQYVQSMMQDQVGSHLFERMLQFMSAEMFSLVYQEFFSDRLLRFAQHPFANYVVQSVVSNAKTASQLETMIEELSSDMASLLFKGKANVVLRAMDSAIRLQAGFDSVRKALLDAFAIDHKQPAKTIRCLLSMRPLSQLTAPPNINNHSSNVIGSQLIQKFLQFPENCNVFLVSSLFAQTIEELLEMARDPAASRALEAFFTSPAVGEKVKRKVLRSLEGRFVDLAQNKYACHLVDRCWSVADIKQKESIAEELCRGEQTLASSTYGRLILRNCRVEQFKRRRTEWIAYEVGKTKKREVFRDFLDGSLLPVESAAKPLEKRKRIAEADEQIIERNEVELQSFAAATADPIMNDVMAAITSSVVTAADKKSKKKSKKSKKGNE